MPHRNGQTQPSEQASLRPYLGVGFGVVTCSTAATLIRLAQANAHSLVIAAWRLALATLILTPIVLVKVGALGSSVLLGELLRPLFGQPVEWPNVGVYALMGLGSLALGILALVRIEPPSWAR